MVEYVCIACVHAFLCGGISEILLLAVLHSCTLYKLFCIIIRSTSFLELGRFYSSTVEMHIC
uniref:Uncharacterized protein n=1 Tax=Arundo donax TaxID=35708 RepID=A0A0A9H3D8_ARUDO